MFEFLEKFFFENLKLEAYQYRLSEIKENKNPNQEEIK